VTPVRDRAAEPRPPGSGQSWFGVLSESVQFEVELDVLSRAQLGDLGL
jgi:hypothetical protein